VPEGFAYGEESFPEVVEKYRIQRVLENGRLIDVV
jgi:hypothetical protein